MTFQLGQGALMAHKLVSISQRDMDRARIKPYSTFWVAVGAQDYLHLKLHTIASIEQQQDWAPLMIGKIPKVVLITHLQVIQKKMYSFTTGIEYL
jgi:hypothetical protein